MLKITERNATLFSIRDASLLFLQKNVELYGMNTAYKFTIVI